MRIACTITVGLILSFAALAQDDRGPDNGRPNGFNRGEGRGRFQAFNVGFNALDTNGDGSLDKSEIDAAPKSLAKLDKNQDGQITPDEVRPNFPPRREAEGGPRSDPADDTVKTLMAFDANGDGKLSKSELPERYQGLFDRADANKDGFLTPDEIRKVAAAQAAPADSPGRGGPEGARGPEGERGDRPRRQFNLIRMDPVLAAIDTDGDGVLSAEEIRNAPSSLRKLDKNADGKVMHDEIPPPAPPQNRPF